MFNYDNYKNGYHFVFASCYSSDKDLRSLDGTCFDEIDDAINFMKTHKDKLKNEKESEGTRQIINGLLGYIGQTDYSSMMIWKEFYDENGNICDSDCIGDIFINDIID